MVFRVALVGCGNLGSRHLQALKKTKRDIYITVCEPVEAARKTAVERYAQIEDNPYVREFKVLEDYHQLELDYDLAIVATNAINRYEIAEWLVEHLRLQYLILEKVVFQSLEEFDRFQQKLDERQVKVWVNCARRMYPYYQEIQPKLAEEKKIDMVVSGGNWGMGSNTIHMLDLYFYFTRFSQYQYDNTGLEEQLQDSKRSGYQEFYGKLKFITEKGEALICCDHGNAPLEIRLTTEKEEILIRESEGIVRYQSELTNLAVEQLIDSGECVLAPYEESAFLHKAVLGSFLNHINRLTGEEIRRCPIT